MAKNSRGKRPCSICRKWFTPDVRQKGRQKTCGSPSCMKEQHRRQCERWNQKHKEYFQNNYLGQKIEHSQILQTNSCQAASDKKPSLSTPHPTIPILPCDIILTEYDPKTLIVIQYLIYQIIKRCHGRTAGFT